MSDYRTNPPPTENDPRFSRLENSKSGGGSIIGAILAVVVVLGVIAWFMMGDSGVSTPAADPNPPAATTVDPNAVTDPAVAPDATAPETAPAPDATAPAPDGTTPAPEETAPAN